MEHVEVDLLGQLDTFFRRRIKKCEIPDSGMRSEGSSTASKIVLSLQLVIVAQVMLASNRAP